ncbi:hypothetical protein B0H14DRAFT_3536176 [Mycena olivaceomarginata]|nr:hypothetical protein B0H14DRAFT_3536176 [Mycena olivaceomarginata]
MTSNQHGLEGLEDFDLGQPIICANYDLEHALELENQVRMAREDSSVVSDDNEEPDIDDATPETARPAAEPRPTSTTADTPRLTGTAKKNALKRTRERAQHRADTARSQSSIVPPVPTARVLQKAAASEPISISFSAENFRATKQCWTGLSTPLEHPLCPHANAPDVLKQHMRYIDWQGDKCHLILDRKGRIIGILVPPPVTPDQWAPVVEAATAAMRAARDQMSFPASACQHRCGNFPTETDGFAFSRGRQTVSNIKQRSQRNRRAMDQLLADPSITRMATYPVLFQAACFQIFSNYHETKQVLLR